MRNFLFFQRKFKKQYYYLLYTMNSKIPSQLSQKFKGLVIQQVFEIQNGFYSTMPVGSKNPAKIIITCRSENHCAFDLVDFVFGRNAPVPEIKIGDLLLISRSNKWCLSSRQFFRLFMLVRYGKCDTPNEKLFQGTALMTNSYRKFILGCEQNRVKPTRELDEKKKTQAGIFRYSEHSAEYHVHTISFLVKLLIFGELPTRSNIPNNIEETDVPIPLRKWDIDRVYIDVFMGKYFPNMNLQSIDSATTTPPGFEFPLDVEPKTKRLPPKVIFSNRELKNTKIPGFGDMTLYDIKINDPDIFHELQSLVVRDRQNKCWGDMSDDEEFLEDITPPRSYSSVAASSS